MRNRKMGGFLLSADFYQQRVSAFRLKCTINQNRPTKFFSANSTDQFGYFILFLLFNLSILVTVAISPDFC